MTQVITKELLQEIISTDYIKSTSEDGLGDAHITSQMSRTGHTFVGSAVGPGSVAASQEGASSAFSSCRYYAQKRITSLLDSGVPSSATAGIIANMTYAAYLDLPEPSISDSEVTALCEPLETDTIQYGATATLRTLGTTTDTAISTYGVGVDMNGAGTAIADASAAALQAMKGYEAYARKMYAFAYFSINSPLELVP